MAKIGQTNRLKISRLSPLGAQLDGGSHGEILLPNTMVPPGAKMGQVVEAFVYPESANHLLATTKQPFAEVGQCAYLEVVEVNEIGAFLEWGLDKNLFVPFAEQQREMRPGKSYAVYIYLDNTGRIAASTKIKKFMGKVPKDVNIGDKVTLFVLRATELGWECAVDDEFLGMVFNNDALDQLEPGVEIDGYIKAIRDGGLVDLCLQPPDITISALGDQILADLQRKGGVSTLTDKSSPNEIFETYGVSKRVYKEALGGLYKKHKVELTPGFVKLKT